GGGPSRSRRPGRSRVRPSCPVPPAGAARPAGRGMRVGDCDCSVWAAGCQRALAISARMRFAKERFGSRPAQDPCTNETSVKRTLAAALLAGLVGACPSSADPAADKEAKKPVPVVIETSMGTIKVELYPDKAPVTVKNFLAYVDDKFYDGTVFHRVIPT